MCFKLIETISFSGSLVHSLLAIFISQAFLAGQIHTNLANFLAEKAKQIWTVRLNTNASFKKKLIL
ncbi:19101_t:CDS:2 [Gigaspora rosea]|nr:19101_t:CDS:2 [Gigaspora rosea]